MNINISVSDMKIFLCLVLIYDFVWYEYISVFGMNIYLVSGMNIYLCLV